MATSGSLLVMRELGLHNNFLCNSHSKGMIEKGQTHFFTSSLSSHPLLREAWTFHILRVVHKPVDPISPRHNRFTCQSFLSPNGGQDIPILKAAATALTRSYEAFHGSPVVVQMTSALGIIAFATWGLGPVMRLCRALFLRKSDSTWNKSRTHHVMTSYLQPLLLWSGAILICRALDPVVLPSEPSQAVKQRVLIFSRSLSTVLAFAYCLSSLIQQTQKFFGESKDSSDAGTMGYEFAGKAVYSAVWVASVSLFMELLGFSTQKWLTAGGLGTVLLTLAGREILTNFLSSVMIHATRPFVLNEWIQIKIGGYEVSGTVEHVGWWSPTIIRGDDREAVHIPNHKFTVTVVRNLSQKTHWRIKTHLAISHLDVNKINNIVADMRKVLAKNSQVEQQKLHRRVFLDNVDPENQALLIMVSCFVKTSRFEEYLCVKEAILLDLLRVISHHRARLATPIRTVQKIYSDADIKNVPFSDTIFTRSRATVNNPFLLIEPSYRVNSDDKTKASTRPIGSVEDKDSKAETPGMPNANSKSGATSVPPTSDSKPTSIGPNGPVQNNSEKPTVTSGEVESSGKTETSSSTSSSNAQSKQDGERPTSSSLSALEDNIILGVALEGSKHMLPIEEEMPPPSPGESKELAGCLNAMTGSTTVGKDSKDDQVSTGPGAATTNDKER